MRYKRDEKMFHIYERVYSNFPKTLNIHSEKNQFEKDVLSFHCTIMHS